jgi:probable rRNA maturation factor
VTLNVSVAADGVRIPVSLPRVRDLATRVLRAEGVRDALLSIAFVTRPAITRLNRAHLGRSGSTDVIAFGFVPQTVGRRGRAKGQSVVGDVYIAPEVARRNALAWGVGVREELTRVVVHGVLHVLGYDHPDGEARTASPMWRRQEMLLRRLTGVKA